MARWDEGQATEEPGPPDDMDKTAQRLQEALVGWWAARGPRTQGQAHERYLWALDQHLRATSWAITAHVTQREDTPMSTDDRDDKPAPWDARRPWQPGDDPSEFYPEQIEDVDRRPMRGPAPTGDPTPQVVTNFAGTVLPSGDALTPPDYTGPRGTAPKADYHKTAGTHRPRRWWRFWR